MKVRSGFVSNSSSSSFVCETELSLNEVNIVLRKIFYFYKDTHSNYSVGSGLGSEFRKRITESFENMFNNPFRGNKTYDKHLSDWNYLEEIEGNTTKGKIIIESAEDNSIPFELFELIEQMFDGVRLHMG